MQTMRENLVRLRILTPVVQVLTVDDDQAVGEVLVGLLRQAGLTARHVTSAERALVELDTEGADVVITDLRMPDMDGLELLRRIRNRWSDLPVIMLTAHGSIGVAVDAMKAGANDFMVKPFDRDEVLHVCRKALAAADYTSRRVESSGDDDGAGAGMIGESPALASVSALVGKAAAGTANVLIRGESGTGKELVARAVHERGPRRKGPFIRLNCAALPDSLLESELFGYEKGAFSGAISRKPGRFELAHGGTLLLDEIGDISPTMQVKLLRVVQEREIERLGGTQTIQIDVRFLAATHRNLEAMVARGEFREDLYYRLNVLPIHVPPLRERRGDIASLARRFVERFAAANGKAGAKLSTTGIARLEREPWPGNVRQLQNFIERLIVLADHVVFDEAAVSAELARVPLIDPQRRPPADPTPELEIELGHDARKAVEDALRASGGNRSRAARFLGISRRTLYYRLDRLGLA